MGFVIFSELQFFQSSRCSGFNLNKAHSSPLSFDSFFRVECPSFFMLFVSIKK